MTGKAKLLLMLFGWAIAIQPGLVISGADAATNKVQVAKKGQFKSTNWVANCRKQTKTRVGGCQLTRSIVQPAKKRVLLGIRIRYSKRVKAFVMVLQMPHGLIIPKGVLAQVDNGKVIKLPIFTSDKNGVYSTLKMSPQMLAAMKSGNKMGVSFVAANGQRVTVGVNLKGFSAGMAKLSK